MTERRVVCAAMSHHGVVICSPRHHDASAHAVVREIGEEAWRKWKLVEQGFVDQFGVFMDRKQAWQVALAANQVIRRVGGDTADGGTLYSENLY